MKVYTKTGDEGWTGLTDGTRVPKDDSHIRACGELDELNAMLGWCRCAAGEPLSAMLQQVQNELFAIGSELATPSGVQLRGMPLLAGTSIDRLETWIDAVWGPLPPLRHFILPAGTELACRLHIARTCCRRAERAAVSLAVAAPIRPEIVMYLNRLSDLLFAWARQANVDAQCPEVPWLPTR